MPIKRSAPRKEDRLNAHGDDEVAGEKEDHDGERSPAAALLLQSGGRTALQHVINDCQKLRAFNEARRHYFGYRFPMVIGRVGLPQMRTTASRNTPLRP